MEQLFPLMLHKNAKDRFNFEDCRFTMTRAKESTGRIVFWNMGITNSFTLEASYGGSNKGHKAYTHFNTRDYEQLGRYWCETLVDVCDPRHNSTIFKILFFIQFLILYFYFKHWIVYENDDDISKFKFYFSKLIAPLMCFVWLRAYLHIENESTHPGDNIVELWLVPRSSTSDTRWLSSWWPRRAAPRTPPPSTSPTTPASHPARNVVQNNSSNYSIDNI